MTVGRLTASSRTRMQNARMADIGMAIQDYIPPNPTGVQSWVDVGDTTTSASRAGGLVLTGRSATHAATGNTTTVAVTATLPSDAWYTISWQNARKIMSLSTISPGLQVKWGPLTNRWTVSLLVRFTQPVATFQSYSGCGSMTLLSATGMTVPVPTGGSIQSSALPANGGLVDGVCAGWPWDAAFVNHWRCIVVRNDAAANTRDILVDGALVSSGPAIGSASVAADSTLTICPSCAVAIAEVTVWDSATVLTNDQINSLVTALRTKWNIDIVPTPLNSSTIVAVGSTPLPIPAESLPIGITSPPVCWFDASDVNTVFANTTGTQRASGFQTVRLLRDRGTLGCHCSFPAGGAIWADGPTYRIQGRPTVRTSAAGTFARSPLEGLTNTSGYTIVALWRLQPGSSGGHPFPVSTESTFTPSRWKEALNTSTYRTMTVTGGLTALDTVLVCWHKASGSDTLTWYLSSGPPGNRQQRWSGAQSGGSWLAAAAANCSIGAPVDLAEMLVWHTGLTNTEMGLLSAYLERRWGLSLPLSVESVALPMPFVPVPTSTLLFTFDATTATTHMFKNATETALVTSNNDAVHVWKACDGSMKNTMKMVSSGSAPASYRMRLAFKNNQASLANERICGCFSPGFVCKRASSHPIHIQRSPTHGREVNNRVGIVRCCRVELCF